MSSKLASYEYDDLGRLVRVALPSGASATYAYDAAGNRTSVVEIPALNPPAAAVTVDSFAKKNTGDFLNNAMLVKLSNGAIVGWGDNTNGVLANGVAAATNQPPQRVVFDPNMPLPPFDETIVDWTFTNANLYVVFSNGWVYSAGQNAYGQLGTGEATSIVRPYLKRIEYFVTQSKSVSKVWACGGRSATDGGGCVYFQTEDKMMYGCGANTAGNLGAGGTAHQSTPIACGGLPNTPNYVVDVVLNSLYSHGFSAYMLVDDGRLFVAGYNGQGQLGTGNTSNVTAGFVQAQKTGNAAIANFVSISANAGWNGTTAAGNALGVDSNGDVWTSGYNGHGELGLGNTTQQTLFTKVTALSNIVKAELGGGIYGMGYALDATGTFYTWGYNAQNNLFKNNTTTPQNTPTVASFVPGIVSKVFFPKDDYLSADAQMIVLTTSGRLVYAGTANGQIGINNTLNPGAYSYIALPRELLDGTENIVDLFVHGSATTQRWFVLTDVGNLYACGNNADSICTGGIASDTIAVAVSCFKLNLVQIDN